jgi:small-conductance mechanosensitive channel
MENRKSRIKRVYTILSGDDEFDRACKIIPDSLCTNLPLNYVMNVVNGAASKLAEQVASAKVVLPWLLSTMGVVTLLFGLAGILAQVYGIQTMIVILALFGIAGAVISFFLPETSAKDDA